MADKITIKEVRGGRVATVPLQSGESVIVVRDGSHYSLGGQVGDIMPAHVITEMQEVGWDHFEQQWKPK